MTKLEFLSNLRQRLSGLPREELEERISFYSEMIDDRMEDGLSVEEAVAAVGSVEEISELPPEESTPKDKQKRNWKTITFLTLGFPIWGSLLIAAIAVVFSLIVSLWAVFVSLAASGIAGILSGIGLAIAGNGVPCAAMLSVGMVCCGLSIFLFLCAKAVTKRVTLLTKKCFSKERGVDNG